MPFVHPMRGLGTILVAFTFFVYPQAAVAANWGCFGKGMLEWLMPGMGYGINGEYAKMGLIGGTRWAVDRQYFRAIQSEHYQEDYGQIYQFTESGQSASGKEETRVYWNQETYQAQYYGSIGSDLLLITWGDLYLNGCKPNNKLFEYAAAPVRFDQLYDDPWFVFPILGLTLSLSQLSQTDLVQYHLGNGLTKSDLYNDAWKQYYLVGFGEEMFFRGMVLEGFNGAFNSWEFSPNASRHLSIFSSAAVFGLAHNGQGFSANSLSAFASGVYLGYAYMPEVNQREMARVIALHAWWDILISYAYFNNAEFFESQSKVEVPLAAVSFRF